MKNILSVSLLHKMHNEVRKTQLKCNHIFINSDF